MQEVIEGVSKRCKGCGEVKLLDEFYTKKGAKDGRHNKCKDCKIARQKECNDARKEAIKEYKKQYYQENREALLAQRAEYYQENREDVLAQRAEYQKTERGKEVKRASMANRKAMKLALPHEEGSSQWLETLARYNDACAITGATENINLEHFMPLSWGHGGSLANNIYPMEGSLNMSKSNKHPFKWAERNLKGEQYEAFLNVARYLAELNGMTLKEFRKFVTWCYKNQRTVEQVKADNERGLTSQDLWRASLSNQ